MTNVLEIDKQLARSMGLKVHSVKSRVVDMDRDIAMYECSCGKKIMGSTGLSDKCEEVEEWKLEHQNPSPTTNWSDYGDLIKWFKEQKLFVEFITWHVGFLVEKQGYHKSLSVIQADTLTDPEQGSRAIAEYLDQETIDKLKGVVR